MRITTGLSAALGAAILCASVGAVRAESCGDIYVVRAGDWLSRIAQSCGVPLDQIVALNEGIDPDAIERGQQIRLTAPAPARPVQDAMRVPIAALPPAPPQKGPVSFSGQIVRDAGTCLYVTDSVGRLYSFAAGNSGLKTGMAVTISGEVVDNWFCSGGAEVLVDSVEPGAPAQVAALDSAAL
jgi:LysM repeat protein